MRELSPKHNLVNQFPYEADRKHKPVVSHAVLAVATFLLIPVILLLIGLFVRYGVQIDSVEIW